MKPQRYFKCVVVSFQLRKQMTEQPNIIQTSFLWDGRQHLSGKLELSKDALIFHFDYFKESNLNLNIPIAEIQTVKVFKLYELVSKGLEVQDKHGHINKFVMENPVEFKREILKHLAVN